jgi:hypothetical protein
MPRFIKLTTKPSYSNEIIYKWINFDRVRHIEESSSGSYVEIDQDYYFLVLESPEEIMEMLNEIH